MPQRISNPFQARTPLGAAIANLGGAIFGSRQSPGEQEKQAAETALLRARTESEEALARQRAATVASQQSIGDILGGVSGARRTLAAPDAAPEFQGPLLPSRDAQFDAARDTVDNLGTSLAQAGSGLVTTPQSLGDLIRFAQASTRGVSDADRAAAFVGAGGKLGQNDAVSLADRDAVAARNDAAALALQDRTSRNDILEANANPSLSQAQGRAFAAQPADEQALAVSAPLDRVKATVARKIAAGQPLTEDEERFVLGNRPNAPRPVAVFDPDPNSQTGLINVSPEDAVGRAAPAPSASNRSDLGLGTAATSALQGNAIQLQRFQRASTAARALAKPENFGITGFFRESVQNLIQQGNAAAQLVGRSALQAKREIVEAGADIDLDQFDTSLPQLDVMISLLAFQAAASIAEQSGRALSDRDFKVFKDAIGGRGFFSNEKDFLARLDQLDQLVEFNLNDVRASLEQGTPFPTVPGQQQAPAGGQSPGRVIRFDAQGNRIQ